MGGIHENLWKLPIMEYICNVSTIIYNSDYKQVVIFGFRNDDSVQFNSTQFTYSCAWQDQKDANHSQAKNKI